MWLKYGLAMLSVFVMIISVRTYINYLNIEVSIENVNQETQRIYDKIAFDKNFLIPYENSEHSDFFILHENSILLGNEYIIRFQERPVVQDGIIVDNVTLSPQESWRMFFSDVLDKY